MSDASISLLSLNYGFHYTGRIAFWVYRVISRFSLEVFLHLVAAHGLRRNRRSDSIGFVHIVPKNLITKKGGSLISNKGGCLISNKGFYLVKGSAFYLVKGCTFYLV